MSAVRDDIKPRTFVFEDDGLIPNSVLPLVLYRDTIDTLSDDPESTIERVFSRNGWGGLWRNGIYDYQHYHTTVHEVLGVARGHALVLFGGLATQQRQGDQCLLGGVAVVVGDQQVVTQVAAVVVGCQPGRRDLGDVQVGRLRQVGL